MLVRSNQTEYFSGMTHSVPHCDFRFRDDLRSLGRKASNDRFGRTMVFKNPSGEALPCTLQDRVTVCSSDPARRRVGDRCRDGGVTAPSTKFWPNNTPARAKNGERFALNRFIRVSLALSESIASRSLSLSDPRRPFWLSPCRYDQKQRLRVLHFSASSFLRAQVYVAHSFT